MGLALDCCVDCGATGSRFCQSTAKMRPSEGYQFNTAHLQRLGIQFCRGLHRYFGLSDIGVTAEQPNREALLSTMLSPRPG